MSDKHSTPARTVEDLQRELLAICRGGSFAETWRKICTAAQWPNLRSEIGKLARVREIRRQIAAINPDACLYYGWAGPGDEPRPRRPHQNGSEFQ